MRQKTLLLLFTVFSCLGNMYSQESLTFNNITVNKEARAGANEELYATAVLKNDYTAYEIHFDLPEGITISSVEKGPWYKDHCTALTISHNDNTITAIQTGDLTPLYKLSNSNNRKLCAIHFYCDETVEVGEYEVNCTFIELTKRIKNSDDTYTTTSFRPLEESGFEVGTFTITVSDEYEPIVLSENDEDAPAATEEEVELKVTRTLSSSNWNTICLPFAMTDKQVYEIFGNPELFGLSEIETSTTDDTKNVTIKFEEIEEIEANIPYIIKPGKDISEFKCLAQIDTDESNAQMTVDGCTFYGTLHAGVQIPVNNIFLSGDKFYFATSATKPLKGFRGYFDISGALENFNNANIKMMIGDEEVTGIEGVILNGEAVKEETPVYSISGVYMGTEREQLPHGLYITNKKKFIVK